MAEKRPTQEVFDRYVSLFNTDYSRLGSELYAPDVQVFTYDIDYCQNTYVGLDIFLQAEDEIKDSVPERIIKVKESWVSEGLVVYHADVIDAARPGWTFSFQNRFEVRDGYITRDWCLGPFVDEKPFIGLDGKPLVRIPTPELPRGRISGSQSLEATQDVFDRYIQLYNTDHVRFIKEVYAPDVVVRAYDMIETQNTFTGRDRSQQALEQVKKSLPNSKIKVNESWLSDELIVYDAELIDEARAGWSFPFMHFLEVKDGRITRDWRYGEYFKDQPHSGLDGGAMVRLSAAPE